MNISKYTKLINHSKGKYIYNSLSNSLIKVKEDLFQKLEELSGKDFSEEEFAEEEETLADLRRAFVVVERRHDDFLQYQAITWSRRNATGIYNITVAPTMDCNYHCYYCFESAEMTYMSDETIRRITRFINMQKNCNRLNLVWFGGEPLMAFAQMEKFTAQLKFKRNTKTDFSIITNGYYLTNDVVDRLGILKINSIQLTVDGIYEDYNKVKFSKNDKNCFETFLDNLDYLLEKQKDVSVVIRVNMDKYLKDKFVDVSRFFTNRYPKAMNLAVVPAFLENICNTTSKTRACDFCNGIERRQFYIDLAKKTGDKRFLYPGNKFTECAIRNANSWTFGPDGTVYKCWENIGNKDAKIGKIDEQGAIRIEDTSRLLRYFYGADPLNSEKCRDCFYLPICYGGCPHKRILQEYEKQPMLPCWKDNDYIEEYLNEFINLKS